jgi:hypothetical protein
MTDHADPCLDRYLAGLASEEDVLALGERLRSDAALRKELLILAAFDAELPGALRDVASEKKEQARVTVATFPAAGAHPARVRAAARRPLARPFPWPAAIAAGILAIVGLFVYSIGRSGRPGRTELAATAPPPSPSPAPTAVEPPKPVVPAEGRLTEISGEVRVVRADGTGQPVVASVGKEVFAGEVLITTTNASARFAYADGSTLRIYRASTVVLSRTDAGPGLDLRQGVVDADIRKQPDGRHLRILGKLMQAEIVGTEFRLMADSRSRWLGVREGVVEVIRVADGQKVALQAGNYAAVAPNWPYMRMNARVCPYWKQICQQAAGTAYP